MRWYIVSPFRAGTDSRAERLQRALVARGHYVELKSTEVQAGDSILRTESWWQLTRNSHCSPGGWPNSGFAAKVKYWSLMSMIIMPLFLPGHLQKFSPLWKPLRYGLLILWLFQLKLGLLNTNHRFPALSGEESSLYPTWVSMLCRKTWNLP